MIYMYDYSRAELATNEYIPIQEVVLENFVILIKNPEYVPEVEPTKKRVIWYIINNKSNNIINISKLIQPFSLGDTHFLVLN